MTSVARAETKLARPHRGGPSPSWEAIGGPQGPAAGGRETAVLAVSLPPAAVEAAAGGPHEGPQVLYSQLIEFDVVIVPFESLQQEIWFAPPRSSISSSSSSSSSMRMSLRGTKKYRKLFSPILAIRWWRLVIDEAQLAGGHD